uniref:Retrovirus-related Pol polyprotein from transposon TNT 1-94 n=1 Tax=Tanacetum cinerariifolium TaxID=118510 RepID=A0A6L2LH43_TANCI|nr:retrovirus-related Pol polyprotein from transposon TNT 1-94 [Tanacetum cinerariifolium]
MSTSNNTTFEFEVHHNGGFKLNPLTYQNGSILNLNVLPTDFEDMISYLSRKISRRFTTLYYTLPPNNALSGLKQIKNDYDTNVMYDIARVAGKIQLFVSHHQIDLSMVLIPNDESLEEALERIISEAAKKDKKNHSLFYNVCKNKNKKKFNYYELLSDLEVCDKVYDRTTDIHKVAQNQKRTTQTRKGQIRRKQTFSQKIILPGTQGTDLAKITKKWPKPDKIEHEIEKNAQKPDPKTFSVYFTSQKVKTKPNCKVKGPFLPILKRYERYKGFWKLSSLGTSSAKFELFIKGYNNVLSDYLVFDEVVIVILEEENRRNNNEDKKISSRQVKASMVTRGRSMEPGSSGSHNHDKSKTGKNKNNFKCFKYGKPGHFKKDCRGSNTSNPQGNISITSDDGNALCNEARLQMKAERDLKIIMVKMHDGTVHTIQDVQHVEGLKKNLLSLGQLDDLGFEKRDNEGGRSIVALHSLSHRVAVTWHQKLGHMSEQGMKILVDRKLLPGLTKSVCVLELVHSDVWQASVQSLEGAKYFVSFIDDYSRRCWVYPIKKKPDMFQVFKVYKAQVELDPENKIKCLRMNNGEQMNRTLLERERAMLATTSLGKSFWVEAINIACYVINRSPSIAVELKTPMEMWMGKLMEKEFQSNDYFEATPQHKVNETSDSQATMTCTLDRERKCPIKPNGNKWVYKIKRNGDDQVERYHTRLVVKGYAQKQEIDFNEIFSHMVWMTTIQVVLEMCTKYDLHLEQLDVKPVFLHGNLEEEIYMLQPEDMDQDSAHMVAASKVPMLKPGEFEIWRMKIEQYIQMIDYALWEVIENGATLPKTQVVEGVITLKFNSIKDAKQLLEVVEKRFGRNAATKKIQMNLLKQQYENFTALSSEMLDQTFDRLQKLVNQLELLADLDTMSMDDLCNNLKVYELEIKGMSSSSSSTQNMAFVSSSNNNTSSTNGAVNISQVVNIAHEVSTTSTQVNAAYSTNIDSLSDLIICSFFASQPNSPQNVHENLEQIHLDDMEEMDLRWQIAMLTIRARRKCRAPRNQDNKHKESSRRSVLVETSTSTALVSCDGLGGYDWSDQAKKWIFKPSKLDLSFTSLDEFVNKLVVENCKAKSSEEEPKVVRKNGDAPIIEEKVLDDVSQPKIEKKIVRPRIVKKEFVKSKQQEKTARKIVKQIEQHRQNTYNPRGNQKN